MSPLLRTPMKDDFIVVGWLHIKLKSVLGPTLMHIFKVEQLISRTVLEMDR